MCFCSTSCRAAAHLYHCFTSWLHLFGLNLCIWTANCDQNWQLRCLALTYLRHWDLFQLLSRWWKLVLRKPAGAVYSASLCFAPPLVSFNMLGSFCLCQWFQFVCLFFDWWLLFNCVVLLLSVFESQMFFSRSQWKYDPKLQASVSHLW